MKSKLLGAAAAAMTFLAVSSPAKAQFGFGGIVYDPRNHAENILTAARTLRQIDNQVQQLANETQMLLNDAQNLASLPTSVAADLQASLARIDELVGAARGIAYEVSVIDSEYRRLFPERYDAAARSSEIIADAEEAWRLAREGLKHSLEVQAEIIAQMRADAATLDLLVAESQGAAGSLQAAQAGNQLMALATKQSMQLQTLLAASARGEALDRARSLGAREQARARFERFMGDGDAYTRR